MLTIVREVIGSAWTPAGRTSAFTPDNVIVVAPYDAQAQRLCETLDSAGFESAPVSTADKVQSREATFSIVPLTASSAADVPRGLEFLLLANRLAVAISRAQWAAWPVYSPAKTDRLPTNVAALAQLSAFIRLIDPLD